MTTVSTQDSQSNERGRALVSVVIVALNEERCIAQCLTSLQSQICPAEAYEVFLVDTGSTDRTVEIAQQFRRHLKVTVLKANGGTISAARNLGASEARGEFVAFLDGDCTVPVDWLTQAVDLLEADGNRVIGARYRVPTDSSWVAKEWFGDLWKQRSGLVPYVPSSNMLLRRDAFFRAGRFDERLATNEDVEFCERASTAGLRIIAVPPISVVHLGTPQTIGSFYRRERWHGTRVHKTLLRNALKSNSTRAVLFALCSLASFGVSLAFLTMGAVSGNTSLVVTACLSPVFVPFAQAVRSSWVRRRLRSILPLTLLYLVYGAARGLCLLGLNGARSPCRERAGAHVSATDTLPRPASEYRW